MYKSVVDLNTGVETVIEMTAEEIAEMQRIMNENAKNITYVQKRALEYPPMADYLDGIVKNDQVQIAKYIADCLAVKQKYPKA